MADTRSSDSEAPGVHGHSGARWAQKWATFANGALRSQPAYIDKRPSKGRRDAIERAAHASCSCAGAPFALKGRTKRGQTKTPRHLLHRILFTPRCPGDLCQLGSSMNPVCTWRDRVIT
jgi:hypothetical protein